MHSKQRPNREGSYVKGRISNPSRNKSDLLLTLWEEIVYSLKRTDPLFSFHKREASHSKRGTGFLIEIIAALSEKSSRKRLTLPSEGIPPPSSYLFYMLQPTGECSDNPLTLRIQETTEGTR